MKENYHHVDPHYITAMFHQHQNVYFHLFHLLDRMHELIHYQDHRNHIHHRDVVYGKINIIFSQNLNKIIKKNYRTNDTWISASSLG